MIVILKQKKRQPFTEPEHNLLDMIDGWIIAADTHEAWHLTQDQALQQELYRMEFNPPKGKHLMRTPGYVMLVQ